MKIRFYSLFFVIVVRLGGTLLLCLLKISNVLSEFHSALKTKALDLDSVDLARKFIMIAYDHVNCVS